MPNATFRGLVAAALTLAASAAHAQDFDVQQFQPAIGPHGAFSTEGARTIDHLDVTGGLLLNYSSRPLTVIQESADGEELRSPIVDQQLAMHALIGVGLFRILQLDLDLPIYLVNEGDLPEEFSQAGAGDLRLRLKGKIVGREKGLGAAVAVDVGLPTGVPNRYIGEPTVPFASRAILDYQFGSLLVALNAGIRVRGDAQFGNNIDLGPAATFGLAAELEVLRGLLLLTGDLYGRSHTRDFLASEDTPVEGMLGGKVIAAHGLTITTAAGGSIIDGAGSPAFRMLLGVGWATRDVDYDDDGIHNDDDMCPDEPEDRDDFEDSDGCPEADNDRDTIGDKLDQCPLDPEDSDGFEDEDGCPDPDNDGDGVADEDDKCRDEAEDVDGFQDEDGCPDLDNDGDGIGDADDRCPVEAEDADGFQDEDGCPDPDNDNDKIPDTEDACPNEAGLVEEKGCPPAETKAVREGAQIKILDKVYFETNEAVIKPESFDLLRQVALVLRTNDDIKLVEVGGHTDDRGADAKNLDLSQRRADAVRQWLVDYGIDGTRLKSMGYGETKPIQAGRSADARAANRRVEFNIVDPAPAAEPEAQPDQPEAAQPTTMPSAAPQE